MRKFFICILLLITGELISQTENYYSVSYLDIDKSETDFSGISNTNIDSNYLSFQKIHVMKDNITPGSTKNYNIRLEKINEFGYQIPTKVWKRILTAGLICTGTGALFGYIAEAVSGFSHSGKEGIRNGALWGGVIGGLIGSAFGGVISIGARDYELQDISKYSKQKKYETIKGLIKKGIINKKD